MLSREMGGWLSSGFKLGPSYTYIHVISIIIASDFKMECLPSLHQPQHALARRSGDMLSGKF